MRVTPNLTIGHKGKLYMRFRNVSLLCVLAACATSQPTTRGEEASQSSVPSASPPGPFKEKVAEAEDASTPVNLELRKVIRDIPKVDVPPPNDLSGETRSGFAEVNGVPSVLTLTKHTQTASFDQLAAFDPNADVLWPGSIAQGKSLQTGILTPIAVKRSPGTITLTNLTVQPDSGPKPQYSQRIKSPTLATVQQAIQELVTQKMTSTPARISLSIRQFFSLDHAMMQMGLSAKWLSGNVKAQLEISNSDEKNHFIVQFVQPYYSVSFSPPEAPEALFGPTVTPAVLEGYIGPSNPPVYISTVTYGRMLFFLVSSSRSSAEVRAALEAGFRSGFTAVDFQGSAAQRQIIQECEIRALVLGGAAESTVDLLTNDKVEGLKKYLAAGANFSLQSGGVPISYQARYLFDNEVARMSFTTDYQVPTFRPQRYTKARVTFKLTSDDKDKEEEIQLAAYRSDEVKVGAGNFGKGTKWGDPGNYPCDFDLKDVSTYDKRGLKLSFYKTPHGSATGCGMEGLVEALLLREDGTWEKWFDVGERRYGDNNPFSATWP